MSHVVRILTGALATLAVMSLGGAAAINGPLVKDATQQVGAFPYDSPPSGSAQSTDSPIGISVVSVSQVSDSLSAPVDGVQNAPYDLPSGDFDIPEMVLDAYQRAATQVAAEDPTCGIRWQILAGIGKVESNHAANGRLNARGLTVPPIIGPVLNGNGVASIIDHDGGRWDGDGKWDRAVGPMQFIPGTWKAFGADGTGDGVPDPHNVYDSTLAAAKYLCHGGGHLDTPTGLTAALLRYNDSMAYVATVQSWITAYDEGRGGVTDDVGPGPATRLSLPGDSTDDSSDEPAPKDKPSKTAGTTPKPPSKDVGTSPKPPTSPPTSPSPSPTEPSPDPSPTKTQTTDPTPGDATPPEVLADVTGDQNDNGDYVGSAMVAITATDADSGVDIVEYDVDGAGFQTYAEPVTINETGQHALKFRATDNAGNVSVIFTVTFTVVEPDPGDLSPPDVSAEVTGDQNETGDYIGSATVTITATDADSDVDSTEYNLNNTGFQPYIEPLTIDEPGQHALEYRATDNAGNTSEVGIVSFTVVAPTDCPTGEDETGSEEGTTDPDGEASDECTTGEAGSDESGTDDSAPTSDTEEPRTETTTRVIAPWRGRNRQTR